MATQWPTFYGRKGESAVEYLEDIQVNIDLSDIAGETVERVARGKFRTGLRGEAKDWWRTEYTGNRENYAHIQVAFRERFPYTTTTNSAAVMQQAVSFERHGGEPLEDYLKRADRLHRKITSPEIREVLASRLLKSMCDGEKDSALRVRVIDRLHAQGKVVIAGGVDCLASTTTFKDVHDTILACTRQFGSGDANEDDGNEGADDAKSLERIVTTIAEKFSNVVTQALVNQAPPQPPLPNRNPNNRQLYNPDLHGPRQNQGGTSGGTGFPRQPDGRPWYCDWCGLDECDHPTWRCPHQNTMDPNVKFTNMRRRQARQEAARNAQTQQTQPHQDQQQRSSGNPQVSSLTSASFTNFISTLSPHDARAYQAEFAQMERKVEAIENDTATDSVMAVRKPDPKPAMTPTTAKPKDKVHKPVKPKKVRIDEDAVGRYLLDESDQLVPGEGDNPVMPNALPPVMEMPELADAIPHSERVLQPDRESHQDQSDGLLPTDIDENDSLDQGDDDGESDNESVHRTEPNGPTSVQHQMVDRVVDEFDRKLRDAMQSAPPPTTPVHHGYDVSDGRETTATDGDPTRPKSHIVGLARSGQDPFDIGDALAGVHLNISLLQLLDAAPRLRTELSKLVAAEAHGNRKKTTTTASPVPMLKSLNFLPHPTHGIDQHGDTFVIRGRGIGRDEVGTVSSCHVKGYAQGVSSNRFMIDSGATLECVSPQFCEKMGVVPSNLEIPWEVTLANDSVDTLTKYVVVNLVVGGISTGVVAFVYGNGSFDVMLSNSWLMRVRAIQDWGAQSITVHTRDGSPETIPFTVVREAECTRIVSMEPTIPIPMTEDRMREILAAFQSTPTHARLTALGKAVAQS